MSAPLFRVGDRVRTLHNYGADVHEGAVAVVFADIHHGPVTYEYRVCCDDGVERMLAQCGLRLIAESKGDG